MSPDLVLPLFHEGVGAIADIVGDWAPDRWTEPVCGDWSANDLAGHLVVVIGWFHDWLNAAERGSSQPPFPTAQLPAENARALAALRDEPGPVRVDRFVAEAKRYATRLPDVWDLPYGYPYGTATVGLHAGAAAGEWHLHAWDLSGGTHRPNDPGSLFVAVGSAVTAGRQGITGKISRALVPIAARRDPWGQLLRSSGR